EYQVIVSFAAGTALVAALVGDFDLAREGLDRLVGAGFNGVPRGADWLAPTAFLAQTCTIVQSVEHAGPLCDALLTQPSTAVRVGPLAGWWGPVDHHIGSLCRVLGRYDEAEARLRNALALERQMGARPFAARTAGELALVLTRSGDDGQLASQFASEAIEA